MVWSHWIHWTLWVYRMDRCNGGNWNNRTYRRHGTHWVQRLIWQHRTDRSNRNHRFNGPNRIYSANRCIVYSCNSVERQHHCVRIRPREWTMDQSINSCRPKGCRRMERVNVGSGWFDVHPHIDDGS